MNIAMARFRYQHTAPVPVIEDVFLTRKLLRWTYNIKDHRASFDQLFLDKAIRGSPAGSLAVYELKQSSTGQQIKDAPGERAIVLLSQGLHLIGQQDLKEKLCPLKTNCGLNLMIVESPEGILHVFYAAFYTGYHQWTIEVAPLKSPHEWPEGTYVLCNPEAV